MAHSGESSWTVTRHGDEVYGYAIGGGHSYVEYSHNGVLYHRDNDGHGWTAEQHGETTYVRPLK